MAKMLWALVCARCIVDRQTNLVSYIDAIEQLTTSELPVTLPPFNVCSFWKREQADEVLKIRHTLVTPSGSRELLDEAQPIVLNRLRHRITTAFLGVEAQEAGEYRVDVEVEVDTEWTTAASVYIDIIFKEAEED